MSVLDMIGSVLIGPLKTIFEVIFSLAYSAIGQPGPAIIVLSLAMNILVLPLYRRADAIQMETRDTENRLKPVMDHIKKTFSGDERMMILQTFYRQNNYSPLSVLGSSVSLLLQIPFFMAAYQFLSRLSALSGSAFGPIADLSAPDGLLAIGGMAINVLPIIMTLVNVISSALYLKGFPLKTKIQLYGMALFFLVFLYNSPAGLVFYWTLNNVFSLVKTLFYKLKIPKGALKTLGAIAGLFLIGWAFFIEKTTASLVVLALGVVLEIALALPVLKGCFPKKTPRESKPAQPNTGLFVLSGLFLSILIGILIPSAYIAASPQEYISAGYFYEPIWYILQTFCTALGFFTVWLGVFYWLANKKGKVIFTRVLWILCGVMLVNYMFFGEKLGILTADLVYESGMSFAISEHIINLLVVAALAAVLYFLIVRFPKKLTSLLLVGCLVLACMGGINISDVISVTEETRLEQEASGEAMPSFNLSKNGKNVVVIFLDRAIGPFVPYMMEENPELLEQFDGFTYYSNTLAFGPFTNFSTPSLYGGYDYTPLEMNLRDEEKLADKHNEALKVVPTIMAENGFESTVIDPSYAGYKWTPNLSMYEDMEHVTAYHASGRFDGTDELIATTNNRSRNFLFFSLMKTLPVSLQSAVYNNGKYHAIPTTTTDTSEVSSKFLAAYNVMKNLTTMTSISGGDENTYMILRTNATHEPQILQEPDYTPSSSVDNSAYHTDKGKVITANGDEKLLHNDYVLGHYHSNMACFIEVGQWLDHLRAEGVYDNTRIIVLSDHGSNLGVFDETSSIRSTEYYRPLLMVKDFGREGFTTSEEFMTVADLPTLTLEGIVENPVNPFTGNPINSDYKLENDTHHILISEQWSVKKNKGNQFNADTWATLEGNVVADKSAWTYYDQQTVLPPDYQE